MKRVFKTRKDSKEIVLDDPNVNMSPVEVMDSYSINYPELTTATIHGPKIEDDRMVCEFKTTVGVKGQGCKKRTTQRQEIMYTTYGTDFGKFSQIYHIKTREHGHKPGHQEQREKETPSRRKPHGFLNARIHSIAPDLYVEDDMEAIVNVITKENLDFLYRLAMRHTRLLNVELPYCPIGRTLIGEKMYLLYNTLDSTVFHHINLELVGDRLQFYIYHFHEWPDYTLLLILIDFTERLKGEVKGIALKFIRRSIKYHRMMDIIDTLYFEASKVYIDYVDFEQLDEKGKKDLYGKEKLFGSYERGKTHRKLCRMHPRTFCRSLEEHIRNYNPSNNKEKGLLELITGEMFLIAKDSLYILNYDYDYASEKERDFEPPPLEYQILLTYSIMDTVTEDMESCFGIDCQRTYNQTPVSFTSITLETEKLLKPENYPERFSK